MTFVPSDHEHAPKIAATPARQGLRGRHVLIILVVSTVLAALALFGAWGLHWGDLEHAQNASAPTSAEAKRMGDTTPAPAPPANP
ncbi:MAG: hypothetical protein JWP35_3758 [Caulobacter sp.]|jgi:flagellar basal body-associated protein FliL|nr:hypothetical protein [Caulobacter sp.]